MVLYSGEDDSVGHLQIFGSTIFAQVLEPGRTKLDFRSQECIFGGYSSHSKAYRFHRKSDGYTFFSRNFTFHENFHSSLPPLDLLAPILYLAQGVVGLPSINQIFSAITVLPSLD